METIRSWIEENRLATGLAVVLLLVIVGIAGVWLQSNQSKFQARSAESFAYEGGGTYDKTVRHSGDGSSDTGAFVEVKEADIDIESEDAEKTSSAIRSMTEEYDGYVERSSKHEGDLYITISLTTRVPSDEFTTYIDRLREEYEVESYNVRNFRLPIQRELDELEIINRTLRDLEDIREEVRKMEANKEKAELLMTLTEKELEIKRRQREFERDLTEKQKRGDMTTVNVQIRQRKQVDLAPENVGNRFRSQVKEMTDNVTMTVITTLTDGIELLFKAFKWVVFLAIVLVPFGLAYKGGRQLYDRYGK